MVKDKQKPKGRMSSYTFFVQTCREEHKKKHPNESINFTEFSRKCSVKWKQMNAIEKKRFTDLADKDKDRFDREMSAYVPPPGEQTRKKKKIKDPNAPKRPLSAFFMYCAEERSKVKSEKPSMGIGEIAKELGERWNKVTPEFRKKYEELAAKDKARYENDMAIYRGQKKDIDDDEDE
ncbi:hypothetical protein SNEBB_008048 [Seison nebaliae]|nr:hypothetical protein SNEBB_008048 [Seison nebaliae]